MTVISMTRQDLKDMTEGYKRREPKVFKRMPECSLDHKIINFWLEEEDMFTVTSKFKVTSAYVISVLINGGIV